MSENTNEPQGEPEVKLDEYREEKFSWGEGELQLVKMPGQDDEDEDEAGD